MKWGIPITTKTLNMAMHGYGMIGRIHWLALQTAAMSPGMHPNADWAHVVVRDLESDTAAKAKHAFRHVHASMDSVPWMDVDALDVVSPNESHAPVVRAALAHGLPVYCEKPLASNIEDTRMMVEMANRTPGCVEQVALNYRFHRSVEHAHMVLQSGVLGKVLTFRAELLHGSYLDPNRGMSWRLQKSSGGGAILDLGVHMIDLVHFLIGRTASMHAQVRTFIGSRHNAKGQTESVGVDDWALLQMTLEGGAVGSVEVSRVHFGREADKVEIVCEYGTIGLDLLTDGLADIKTLPGHELPPNLPLPLQTFRIPSKYCGDPFLQTHAVSLLTFLHRVRGQSVEYPVPTFADALAAEEVVHRALTQ